jgi:uncharacterized protein
MKYLLVLAVVLVAFYIWRTNRERAWEEAVAQEAKRNQGRQRHTATPGPPAQMVVCHHCGLHLPRSESVEGRLGHYCSPEHRRLSDS